MGFSGVNEKKLQEAKMEPATGTVLAGTQGPSYLSLGYFPPVGVRTMEAL